MPWLLLAVPVLGMAAVTGTLLVSHSQASTALRAGTAQQGCRAAARECCTEVFSVICAQGQVEQSSPLRAALGTSKCKDCLWALCVAHQAKCRKYLYAAGGM